MCGILTVLSENSIDETTRNEAYHRSRLQRHRGPDESGIETFDKAVIVHERLALVGIEEGQQPYTTKDEVLIMVANCEIYNWKELEAHISEKTGVPYHARSDAEVILGLYELYGEKCLDLLSGMFAFVIYDKIHNTAFIARDPFGIIPLYYGYDTKGQFWVASEMKCLVDMCDTIEVFGPSTYMKGSVSELHPVVYYNPEWMETMPTKGIDFSEFQNKLINEIALHLPDTPRVACLLSGGLDSSLIAALAQRLLKKEGRSLTTYSIGIKRCPDLEFARITADYIGSKHVEVIFTPTQGVDAVKEVIWFLESYDVTTIRAGIPMYFVSRRVKKDGFKAVLSGEGADEIFGGYLYFHQAPSPEEFHFETVSRVKNISYADCLRTNKSTMAWGVEARVPFLSKPFVECAMSIAPELRMVPRTSYHPKGRSCEKYLLRNAFSEGILPDVILWRQKEQFSDGVGYNWIDSLKEAAEKRVSDAEFANAATIYSHNTPTTKEAFYYRKLYHDMFGHAAEKSIKKWVPRTDWGCSVDPSGRVQPAHLAYTTDQ